MTTSYETGLDSFFLTPGAEDVPPCGVCGGALQVTRGLVGPTSWAAAIAAKQGSDEVKARVKIPHDQALCPDAGEGWHVHARRLVREAADTASPSVRALILGDLAAVLATR